MPATTKGDGVPNGHSARLGLNFMGSNQENPACGHYSDCQGKNLDKPTPTPRTEAMKPAGKPRFPAIITGAGEVLIVTPAAFMDFARLVAPFAVIKGAA